MEDLPIPRSDQISIANEPAAVAPNHGLSMFPADEKRLKEGCINVPHPPSPQMVIEILSAIAWPTRRDLNERLEARGRSFP
jgi:hypothetical protein